MKKSSVNTFTGGLVCDLDPINVPNNVLTDCLNGTIITYDDNEFSLQNDKGNYPLKDCKLHPGFIPVGIKEHGGILYIVSLNPLTGEEEIGSYPSPKLYNGGIVDGNVNIEYVIDKAFEEANSEELDYSELESKCKSWYYADPKLKLNVGDKFWFEEELENMNFEKIEKYIIDENSIPHRVSNDWLNKSLEYTSPISGTMMLKNKIFEIANSSAETNTFTCWSNDDSELYSEMSATTYNTQTTTENFNGKHCIVYNNRGTLYAIKQPSTSEVVTDIYNYDDCVLDFESANGGYHIRYGTYFLKYSPEFDTGLEFISYPNSDTVWDITKSNDYVRISPRSNSNYRINYHNGKIRCDGAGAGSIILLDSSSSNGNTDNDLGTELVNNIDTLFSFTHKLYIDDYDTLQWLINDYLKYKVNLKVNDLIIYSNIFDGNSLISDSKTFGEYEIDIESRQATNLEWYSNNKIISKYFVTVIKNIDSNDQISAEIIPIVSISDTKNIIMSQFAKQLNNSVSEYTSTAWTIGEEYYRFYNHPIDNVYKTQSIELDIKGPIEASDDFLLNCKICAYNSSNEIMSKQFIPGIGKSILQIEYNNLFVKEDAYTVEYSIMIAGTSVKSVKKKLITSELFNYDEFLEYNDYTDIDDDLWISKYSRTITEGNVTMSVQNSKTDLPKSLYTYMTGNPDYVNRNIPYPNFIAESDYDEYSNFKEARLSGYNYSTIIKIEEPSYLQGPLWTITKSPYFCTNALGKISSTTNSSTTLLVPVGSGQYVNFINSNKTICGRINNVEVITPKTITYKWAGFADISANNGRGRWWVTVSDNSSILKTFELDPPSLIRPDAPGANNITDVTDIIKSLCSFEEDLVNIRLKLTDGHDENDVDTHVSITAEYHGTIYKSWGEEDLIINNACKSANEWFVKIPDGTYVKVNADKNEKYQSGYWCNFSEGNKINFNSPWINVSMNISVKANKINFEKEFIWEESVINSDININNDSNVSSEINSIISKGTIDKASFTKITTDYVNPNAGKYVKGIVNIDSKAYSSVTELTNNYRNYDKFEILNSVYKNGYVGCSGLLRTPEGDWNDGIKVFFGETNGGFA